MTIKQNLSWNGGKIYKLVWHDCDSFNEIKDKNKIRVAEQNINKVRKVMINEWNLDDIKKGKVQFFRPVN